MEVEMKAPFDLTLCKQLQEIIIRNASPSHKSFDIEVKKDTYYPCKNQNKQFRIRDTATLSPCPSIFQFGDPCTVLESFINRYLLNTVTDASEYFLLHKVFVTEKEKYTNSEGVECNKENEYEIRFEEINSILENNKDLVSEIPYFTKCKKSLGFYFLNGLHYELVKVSGVNSIYLEIEGFAEDETQVKDRVREIKNAFMELGITNFEARSWAELIQSDMKEKNAETKINIISKNSTEEICMQLTEAEIENLLRYLYETSKTTQEDELDKLMIKFKSLKNALHMEEN